MLGTSPRQRCARAGFTLVELLVVIAIIGILVGLLLPAVQSAREAGRRTQCQNNLRQMGIGSVSHMQAQGYFPTGGWGYYWVGDPDQGYGRNQPAGWMYNLLPYLEQENVHKIGAGLDAAGKFTANIQMVQTPLSVFHCPTRRRAKLYPHTFGQVANNCGNSATVARSDYAGNCGWGGVPHGAGPSTIAAGMNQTAPVRNGMIYERSEVKLAHIKDGASNTLLAGEKYLCPDNYENGTDGADNENMYVGNDNDILRSAGPETAYALMQDRVGYPSYENFGSAHPGSAFFVRCDGSVRGISYSVDPILYGNLGSRNDGGVIDESRL